MGTGTGLKVTGIQYEKPDGTVVEDSLTITNEYEATGSWTPVAPRPDRPGYEARRKLEFTVTEMVNGEEMQVSQGTATDGLMDRQYQSALVRLTIPWMIKEAIHIPSRK